MYVSKYEFYPSKRQINQTNNKTKIWVVAVVAALYSTLCRKTAYYDFINIVVHLRDSLFFSPTMLSKHKKCILILILFPRYFCRLIGNIQYFEYQMYSNRFYFDLNIL